MARTLTGTRTALAIWPVAAHTAPARLAPLAGGARRTLPDGLLLRAAARGLAHVHGAGQAVLLHEELELDLLGRLGRLGLAGRQVLERVEALATTARVVAGVAEQDGMGHAGGRACDGGRRLAHEGEVGDAGGAVRGSGHRSKLRPPDRAALVGVSPTACHRGVARLGFCPAQREAARRSRAAGQMPRGAHPLAAPPPTAPHNRQSLRPPRATPPATALARPTACPAPGPAERSPCGP